MLDPSLLTFDQLRMLVAIDETGSFSAAGRVLGRVQSSVSHSVARTEEILGVLLFDRSKRRVVPTAAGRAILQNARGLLDGVDRLAARAQAFHEGDEASLTLVVDTLIPVEVLVRLCEAFQERFAQTSLCLSTETLGMVGHRVLERAPHTPVLGLAHMADIPAHTFVATPVGALRLLPACAPTHPLARTRSTPLQPHELAAHTQIVLSSRPNDPISTPPRAVLSDTTWNTTDVHTKRALMRAGLGWGNLPEPLLNEDLHAGTLVLLDIAPWTHDTHTLQFCAVHTPNTSPGPAMQWIIHTLQNDALFHLTVEETSP